VSVGQAHCARFAFLNVHSALKEGTAVTAGRIAANNSTRADTRCTSTLDPHPRLWEHYAVALESPRCAASLEAGLNLKNAPEYRGKRDFVGKRTDSNTKMTITPTTGGELGETMSVVQCTPLCGAQSASDPLCYLLQVCICHISKTCAHPTRCLNHV